MLALVKNHRPPAIDPDLVWENTRPGDLLPPSPATRPQPALRVVMQGLEMRELEGQTVFDQLFELPPRGAR